MEKSVHLDESQNRDRKGHREPDVVRPLDGHLSVEESESVCEREKESVSLCERNRECVRDSA